MFKLIRNIISSLICLALLCVACSFGISFYMMSQSEEKILTMDESAKAAGADCIIVLGCGVREDGSPSLMLSDRVDTGVALYKNGISDRIIMSGDHGKADYDEVNTMKDIAVNMGVKAKHVFMDHAGFSTYDSIYRAKEIFGAKKIVIVSQEYHLYRALYIAKSLEIEAVGVSADARTYSGQEYRDAREVLARAKDFVICLFKPEPTLLGELIDLRGNGNQTNG